MLSLTWTPSDQYITGVRWFQHEQRRYAEYTGRKVLEMEMSGKRERRPNGRFMDLVRGGKQAVASWRDRGRYREQAEIETDDLLR